MIAGAATAAAATPAASVAPAAASASVSVAEPARAPTFADLLGLQSAVAPAASTLAPVVDAASESELPDSEPMLDDDGDSGDAAPLLRWLFDAMNHAAAVPEAIAPIPTPIDAAPVELPLASADWPPAAALVVPTTEPRATSLPISQPTLLPAAGVPMPTASALAAPTPEPAVAASAFTAAAAEAALAPEPAPPTIDPMPALSLATAPADARGVSAVLAATPPAPPRPLQTDAPDFAADVGERIAWQVGQGIGEANIELHPAELGALTIRIETQGQQAQVLILAAEPGARALLSQCLPQLRELLGASGLTMTRAQVEAGDRRSAAAMDRSAATNPLNTRRRISGISLVDAYV